MKRRQQPQRQKKYSSARSILPSLFLTAALFSHGCSEQAPAPAPVAPKAPAPVSVPPPAAQPIAPQPPVEAAPPGGVKAAESTYTYRPAERRDPFAPIIVREERKEQRAAVPPLERYGVTEFKLTGIVWGGFGYNAMLEGPDGKGYFVRVGTVVGQNRGVIRKITKDSLIVEETFKNYMGVAERKEITITLRQKQEGLP